MTKQLLIKVSIFLLGAGTGFLVAKKVYEDYYANIAQEEIDSVKEYYSAKYDSSNWTPCKKVDDTETSAPKVGVSRTTSLDNNPIEAAKRNYHLGAGAANPTVPAADDTDEDEEDSDEDDGEERDAAGMTEKEINPDIDRTEPYLIDANEFKDEFDHHDKVSLFYYRYDDVLTEDDGTVLNDIEGTVGDDALAYLDTHTTVWVRNEPLAIDYEVIALNEAYADTVAKKQARQSAVLSPREQHLQRQKTQQAKRENE